MVGPLDPRTTRRPHARRRRPAQQARGTRVTTRAGCPAGVRACACARAPGVHAPDAGARKPHAAQPRAPSACTPRPLLARPNRVNRQA
eukprot:163709-Chlamydomonas_euryale.AAC.1